MVGGRHDRAVGACIAQASQRRCVYRTLDLGIIHLEPARAARPFPVVLIDGGCDAEGREH